MPLPEIPSDFRGIPNTQPQQQTESLEPIESFNGLRLMTPEINTDDVRFRWSPLPDVRWYKLKIQRIGKDGLWLNEKITDLNICQRATGCSVSLSQFDKTINPNKQYRWKIVAKTADGERVKTGWQRLSQDGFTPEPQLELLYREEFVTESPLESGWLIDGGWNHQRTEQQEFLSLDNERVLTFDYAPRETVAIEGIFRLSNSTAELQVRQSETGSYRARLQPDGTVQLWRGDVMMETAQITLNDSPWHTVRISAVDDTVRVSVNGNDVIVESDPTPLPAGEIAVMNGGTNGGSLDVDSITIYLPPDQIPWLRERQSGTRATPIIVNSVSELITALQGAQTCSAPVAIQLNPANGDYVLTATYETATGIGATGLPRILCDVTIDGQGATIRRSSSDIFRIFLVDDPYAVLQLENITISNGYSEVNGGGIYNRYGKLILHNTVVSLNYCENPQSGFSAHGGGIRSQTGGLEIYDSDISNNQCEGIGGISVIGGAAEIINSKIENNDGSSAIAVSTAYATIYGSEITFNQVMAGSLYGINSSIALVSSSITNTQSSGLANGLYIHINTTVDIQNSLFENNDRGISNFDGTISIANSCLINNLGHGIYNYYLAETIIATNNWWGDASGPSGEGPGTGDSVSTNVDYSSWLTSQPDCGVPSQPSAPNVIQVTDTGSQTLGTRSTDPPNPDDHNDGICTIREAILKANALSQGTDPFTDCTPTGNDYRNPSAIVVELYPHNYVFDQPLDPISGSVVIKESDGGFATIARMDQAQDMRLFNISPGGSLTLENIVVSNGRVIGDGGAILNAGTLKLKNSAVIGNFATGNGGGIYQVGTGQLNIEKSLIQDNVASGQGAAIYYDGSGLVTIAGSCFVDNWGLTNNSSIDTTSNASMITATGNWWGMPTGAFGVGYGQGDAVKGNIAATSPLTNPPMFNDSPCGTSMLILAGDWADDEQSAIYTGAYNVGDALSTLTISPTDSPIEAFRRVMVDATGEVQIEFNRATTSTSCTTNDNPGDPLVARITCGINNIFTEFTAVHELGHVFIDRTNDILRIKMDEVTKRVDDEDEFSPIIFGRRSWILANNTSVVDWDRGQSGWGSDAPTFDYFGSPMQSGACEGSSSELPTSFQQNPCHVKNWLLPSNSTLAVTETEEAATDMFLNWVYKALDLSDDQGNLAFQDVDWNLENNPASTIGPTGYVRFSWISSILTELIGG